jgi:hypothetical protein
MADSRPGDRGLAAVPGRSAVDSRACQGADIRARLRQVLSAPHPSALKPHLGTRSCTQLSRLGVPLGRSLQGGHEDAFPGPRLSARCRFSQGTFAGTRGNGRDAPRADLAAAALKLPASIRSCHSRGSARRCLTHARSAWSSEPRRFRPDTLRSPELPAPPSWMARDTAEISLSSHRLRGLTGK